MIKNRKYYTMLEDRGAIFILSPATPNQWQRDINTHPKNMEYWSRIQKLEKLGYKYIYPKDIEKYGEFEAGGGVM